MHMVNASEQPRILFVDDELPVLKSLHRLARSKSWRARVVTSGNEGLEALAKDEFDIVVSDMRMPGMDGAEFLTRVKEQHPNTIRILLTGYSDIHTLEVAINEASIFNYLTKPWDDLMLNEIVDRAYTYLESERERKRLEELTRLQNRKLGKLAVSLDKEVKERTIEIEQALTLLQGVHANTTAKFLESLTVLSQVTDWKEGNDLGHNRFVVTYAEKLAKLLGMNSIDVENTRIAATLHRIGMLGLPDELRDKPRFSFTPGERKLYQEVPIWGDLALANAPSLQEVAKIIRYQCEWVNGNGYPDKLTDKEIPLASKIIHLLSDFYDVMNGRMEAHIEGIDEAKRYVKEWTGRKYDTQVVQAFAQLEDSIEAPAKKSLLVKTEELHAGMVLAANIVTAKGMLLLAKGSIINNTHITTLRGYEKRLNEQFSISVRAEDLALH